MQTALKLRKAFSANVVFGAFVAKVATLTKPVGSGVFNLYDTALGIATEPYVPENLELFPYGSNADNTTLNLRVWGWQQTTDATPIWVPQLITELACTLSAACTLTPIGVNNFLADTIAVTKGAAEASGSGVSVNSPANDTPGSALVGLRGCELIEFAVGTGAVGVDANCLWRTVTNRLNR
jgi:hypothetical protein